MCASAPLIARSPRHAGLQEWVLDAPGCLPFREVEEVAGASGSRSDRHVTRRALKVSPSAADNKDVVLDTARPELRRIETTVPIDLSELMRQDATHRAAIVGDAASAAADAHYSCRVI